MWIEKKTRNERMMSNYLCKYLLKHLGDERIATKNLYLKTQDMKLNHKDELFYSKNELLDHLVIEYPGKMANKNVLEFQDDEILWIG